MYLKRKKVSKIVPIVRKGTKYVVVPSHGRRAGIALLVAMRDVLGLVQTRKELKKILLDEKVLVNGKIAKKDNLTLLLFDTLSLKELEKYYRVSLSEKGKIALEEIKEKDIGSKISKVVDKKILKGKKIQINLNDGRNLLTSEKVNVGDSVLINFKDKRILGVLPIKEGANVLIIKGKHMGTQGTVSKVEEQEIMVKSDERDLAMIREELIVLD